MPPTAEPSGREGRELGRGNVCRPGSQALWRRAGRERVWRDRQKVQPQDRDSACLKGWVSVFTPLANRPTVGGRHEHSHVIDMNNETVLSHVKGHTASKGWNSI